MEGTEEVSEIVDTHCHVHLADNAVEIAHDLRLCKFATCESNWATTIDAVRLQDPLVGYGIGVHPWCVEMLVCGVV